MVDKSFVHELIHDLNKSEKRYIRMDLEQQAKGKVNKNLELFDGMHQVKKAIKHQKPFPNYQVHKTYLTESIFKSLRNFHAQSDAEYVAHQQLKNCMICHGKKWNKEFEKRIKKLKKFCYEQNLFGTLFQVIKTEMWNNKERLISNDLLHQEVQHVIKQQENMMRYLALYDEILFKVFQSDSRVQESIKQVEKNKLIQNEELATCFLSKNARLNTLMLINYVHQDYNQAHYYHSNLFDLIRNNKPYLKFNGRLALLTFGNIMTLSFFSNSKKRYQTDYKLLLLTHKSIKGFEHLKFEQYLHFTLLYQKVMHDYSGLNKLTEYFNSNFSKHKKYISLIKETDIYFNFAVAAFKTGNRQQALDWFVILLNHPKIRTRQYAFEASLIFELILHFDLEHISLLGNKSRAAVRYFKSKEKPTQFELTLIQFLQKFPNRHDKVDVVRHFKHMKKLLKSIPKEELEYFNTIHFDYNNWLDEKIKSFK